MSESPAVGGAVTKPASVTLTAGESILPAFGNWQPCHECDTPTKHADDTGQPACDEHRA